MNEFLSVIFPPNYTQAIVYSDQQFSKSICFLVGAVLPNANSRHDYLLRGFGTALEMQVGQNEVPNCDVTTQANEFQVE